MRTYSTSPASPADPIAANGGARVHAVSALDAAPGATIRFARGGDLVPIYRGEVLESLEGWDWIEPGPGSTFTLRVFQAPLSTARPTSAAAAGATSGGASSSSSGEPLHAGATNPVAVAAGAVVQLLDANTHRTTLTVQNDGINPLWWSTDPGLDATGAKAEGILAAAGAAGDGSGGFLALPGWLGPLYVSAKAGAASSVRVKAY